MCAGNYREGSEFILSSFGYIEYEKQIISFADNISMVNIIIKRYPCLRRKHDKESNNV
jgi:hypothetical protein